MTHELLRRGAHPFDNYLIYQGSEIRMFALILMNCTLDKPGVAFAAAMLVRACLQKLTVITHPLLALPHTHTTPSCLQVEEEDERKKMRGRMTQEEHTKWSCF